MLVFVIVLLAIWAILAVVGFAFKGLFFLAIVAIILFIATAVIGFIRRSVNRSRA